MKTCFTCKVDKEETAFGKVAKSTDGLNSNCKDCKRKYDNDYHKKRKPVKKGRKTFLQNERVKQTRKRVNEYKGLKGCALCPENESACLDFHHTDDNKEFTIGNAMTLSYDSIKKEMDKCVVLCANCHRKVHAGIKSV